jgi:uncharacterized NAD(P)/FAD-binding protein YdhS
VTRIGSVAIIGGGFSGALMAINLLRHEGPQATIIERRPRIGAGIAFSTTCPDHLLNVRAANMSALPDEPEHFVRWLSARGFGATELFVSRAVYGEYLAELVDEAASRAHDRLRVVHASAMAIEPGAPMTITLDDGGRIAADAAVLALGNLPPMVPNNLDPSAVGARYAPDPWADTLAKDLTADDHVLILGTGPTMVDIVLALDSRGFRGRVTALSRRGLLPLRHGPGSAVATELKERPAAELSVLLRTVRARARAIGWRAAIDELRPFTQSMWLAASTDQRRRFLRHARPWWDIHRHRLPPAAASRLDELRSQGRLAVIAGRALSFTPSAKAVEVVWRSRGSVRDRLLSAQLVVNCMGPQSDLSHATEPLLVQLAQQGQVAPDPLGLGLVVDGQARAIGADNKPNPRLFALGPMTRGTFWEITAVPDIRVQAWNLARYISNAYWIGGEGL